jgi:hypothetical protein
MSLTCVPYSDRYLNQWEEVSLNSKRHSVLQSRSFLEYHGSRFKDASLVFVDSSSGYVSAIFPAAFHISELDFVVSHPGLSFGGLLLRKSQVSAYDEVLQQAMRHYSQLGMRRLRIKVQPSFVSEQFDDTATHHGLKHGQLINSDLWAVLNLQREFSSKDKNYDIQKAKKLGISCNFTDLNEDWVQFYNILCENLAKRHEAKPVHNLDELFDLRQRLGSHSKLLVARDAKFEIVAATWMVEYGNGVVHTQYICSTAFGRQLMAVDALLFSAIEYCKLEHKSILSLGHCSQSNGWEINLGLLAFKSRFGFGLSAVNTFDYEL